MEEYKSLLKCSVLALQAHYKENTLELITTYLDKYPVLVNFIYKDKDVRLIRPYNIHYTLKELLEYDAKYTEDCFVWLGKVSLYNKYIELDKFTCKEIIQRMIKRDNMREELYIRDILLINEYVCYMDLTDDAENNLIDYLDKVEELYEQTCYELMLNLIEYFE